MRVAAPTRCCGRSDVLAERLDVEQAAFPDDLGCITRFTSPGVSSKTISRC